MFCPACGKGIANESIACNFCGKTLRAKQTVSPTIIVGVVVLALLAWGLYSGAIQTSGRHALPDDTFTREMAQRTQPVWETKRETILDEKFTVKAGEFASRQFTVPDGARDAEIAGHFESSGGSGNEVNFAVLDYEELRNWSNGQEAKGFYFRKAVVDTFKVGTLAPGKYAVAFSNQFSLLSAKDVRVEITLHYKTLVYR